MGERPFLNGRYWLFFLDMDMILGAKNGDF